MLDDASVCDATSLNIYQAALKDKIENVYLAEKPRSKLPRLVCKEIFWMQMKLLSVPT